MSSDTKSMVANYMEAGFLENITDMFKADRGLFSILPHLISDERGRVRLGAVALVEGVRDACQKELQAVIPDIAGVLNHSNPTIRADAAYLLGVIGHRDALPYLRTVLDDKNPLVRETIQETIEGLTLT